MKGRLLFKLSIFVCAIGYLKLHKICPFVLPTIQIYTMPAIHAPARKRVYHIVSSSTNNPQ